MEAQGLNELVECWAWALNLPVRVWVRVWVGPWTSRSEVRVRPAKFVTVWFTNNSAKPSSQARIPADIPFLWSFSSPPRRKLSTSSPTDFHFLGETSVTQTIWFRIRSFYYLSTSFYSKSDAINEAYPFTSCLGREPRVMAEQFRIESISFKSLPWRTHVLCNWDGLGQLNDIPELSVSLEFLSSHMLTFRT